MDEGEGHLYKILMSILSLWSPFKFETQIQTYLYIGNDKT